MKRTITTLVMLLLYFSSLGNGKTFEKLREVNAIWKEQGDIKPGSLPLYSLQDERWWIKTHLSLVESILRKRDINGLTAVQQANRLKALDHLHQYWQSGAFPINEDYAVRTPIFIDKHDNFCAVGYLVKATGHEAISRKIAAETNLAYVRQMNYPQLDQWAAEYGFTKDELAWIQPGYPPTHHGAAIGKGTNGVVNELFVNAAGDKLYVGGSFSMVDSTISANNVAYITESNGVYSWHQLGAGFNGPVYAIAEYNGQIFAAGAFTMSGDSVANNVAYWDGTQWRTAGCIYGTVKDLLVHNGELYAGGEFDVCAALSEVNFAKWNPTFGMWQQMIGLDGYVNTLETVGQDIVLGGRFSYMTDWTDTINIIKWNEAAGQFQTYGTTTGNEVMDLQWFSDTLYAACKWTDPLDSTLLIRLDGQNWGNSQYYFYYGSQIPSFNTLNVEGDTMMVGGQFNTVVGMTFAQNCLSLGDGTYYEDFFLVDSAINKMVRFKGDVIAGGRFKTEASNGTMLNSIARMASSTGVPDIINQEGLSLYPNPAKDMVRFEVSFEATGFMLFDVTGKKVMDLEIKRGSKEIALPQLHSGVYMAEVHNGKGTAAKSKLVIE